MPHSRSVRNALHVTRRMYATDGFVEPSISASQWTDPETVEAPKGALEEKARFVQNILPSWGDYASNLAKQHEGAQEMRNLGLENMKSGNIGQGILGGAQTVLGTALPALAPVGAAFDTAVQTAKRISPHAGHAVEVATMVNPDMPFLGASKLAGLSHYAGELSPAAAMAGIASGAPRAAESAVSLARDVMAPQRELSPLGLYSHGAETAAALPQAKATPQQFRSTLEGLGVKPVEFENSGFDAAFAGRSSVTRDEVAQLFSKSMPKIEERVLTGPTDTQYGQYVLPGSENYREVLLKYVAPDFSAERAAQLRDVNNEMVSLKKASRGVSTPEYESKMSDLVNRMDEINAKYPKTDNLETYKSPHWKDDPNVVAHLRMSDRVGPNGEKILHIEEAQSDLGQSVRKEGFRDPEVEAKRADLAKQVEKTKQERSKALSDAAKAGAGKDATDKIFADFNQKLDPLETALDSLPKSEGNIRLPFVSRTQDWTDLAIKRVLKEAAEGGYDRVIWTPGAEQSKRYNLRQYVDELEYSKNDNGTYNVTPFKNGEPMTGITRPNIPERKLESLFGRDVANKMKNQEGTASGNALSLSGDDLAVGGEGMKSYYDKMFPKYFQEQIKKHDKRAKIEPYDLITKPGERVADEAALTGNSQLIEQGRFWDDARGENVNGYRVTSPGGQDLGVFEDLPDAHSALLQVLGDAKEPDTILKTQSFAITPQMRESIFRGQHLFADGGSVPYPKFTSRSIAEKWTPPEDIDPRLGKFIEEYPAKMAEGIANIPQAIWDTVKYPGQLLYGEKQFDTDEAIKRAVDITGAAMTGSFPFARAAAGEAVLGAGPIRKANTPPVRRDLNTTLDDIGRSEYVADPLERDINLGRFLSDTKVTNWEGDPKVLYHATPKDFSEFIPGGVNPRESGPAIWLSPYPDHLPAGHHVGGPGNWSNGANVMPVWASIKSPLQLDTPQMYDWARKTYAEGSGEFPQFIAPQWKQKLIEDGYDGIIHGGHDSLEYGAHRIGIGQQPGRNEEIIAFYPHQLKSSTGNSGHFDPNNPDITRAKGGVVNRENDSNSVVNRALVLTSKKALRRRGRPE